MRLGSDVMRNISPILMCPVTPRGPRKSKVFSKTVVRVIWLLVPYMLAHVTRSLYVCHLTMFESKCAYTVAVQGGGVKTQL